MGSFDDMLQDQRMPDEQLFLVQEVELVVPVEKIISRSGRKTICQQCGEEIINEREIVCNGRLVCRACYFNAYNRLKQQVVLTNP